MRDGTTRRVNHTRFHDTVVHGKVVHGFVIAAAQPSRVWLLVIIGVTRNRVVAVVLLVDFVSLRDAASPVADHGPSNKGGR